MASEEPPWQEAWGIVDTNGHLGTVSSSERFKDAIKPMDKASETILALKPVTFRYKHELDPDGIPQFGLVAEDVEKVNPALVARDDKGEIYTVRYDAVNAMLLNEFLKGASQSAGFGEGNGGHHRAAQRASRPNPKGERASRNEHARDKRGSQYSIECEWMTVCGRGRRPWPRLELRGTVSKLTLPETAKQTDRIESHEISNEN